MNTTTWWQDQKPYVNTAISAALTHSAPPEFPTCPAPEITNEKNAFATGETVFLAVYLRDQRAGTSMNLKILRPNGTTFSNWNFNLTDNYGLSYWYWTSTLPSTPGNWTWRVTYQGQVVDHNFTMGTLSVADDDFEAVSIYPNPINDVVNIKSNVSIKKATVVDMLGKTVLTLEATQSMTSINLEALSNGMYFLTLEGENNQEKTLKLIKE